MKIKHTAFVLLFFMYFTGYANAQPNPTVDSPAAATPDRVEAAPPPAAATPPAAPPPVVTPAPRMWVVPVTLETVNAIQNFIHDSRDSLKAARDLGSLRFFISKPVSITPIQSDNSGRIAGVASGAIVRGGQNISPPPLYINTDDPGTLFAMNSEIIEVYFKGSQLRFIRNSQGRYDLFSAVFGVETNALRHEGSPPQLLILDNPPELNNRVEIRAVPDSAPDINQRRNDPPPRPGNPGTGNPNQAGQSRNISERGYVTQRGIAEYVKSKNPSVDGGTLGRLIELYINEAGSEGINHDIAIAQMLYATSNLSSQRMMTHNYGGLSSTPSREVSFCDMTEGVRAHIQHLKGYASSQPPRAPIVDPRYQILVDLGYCGTVRTFDDLYGRWTANPDYGNSIEGILRGLYQFSANYR